MTASPGEHAKFAEIPTPSLFPVPKGARVRKSRGEAQRTVQAFARASCPSCANVSVALVMDGGHLRWRQHMRYRARGAGTPCSASGEQLHALPPRDGRFVLDRVRDGGPNTRPATCGCEAPATSPWRS